MLQRNIKRLHAIWFHQNRQKIVGSNYHSSFTTVVQKCFYSQGISFLEVKNHTMLSYLINLMHLANMKCRGNSIKDDSTVERLVELRTVNKYFDYQSSVQKFRKSGQNCFRKLLCVNLTSILFTGFREDETNWPENKISDRQIDQNSSYRHR